MGMNKVMEIVYVGAGKVGFENTSSRHTYVSNIRACM